MQNNGFSNAMLKRFEQTTLPKFCIYKNSDISTKCLDSLIRHGVPVYADYINILDRHYRESNYSGITTDQMGGIITNGNIIILDNPAQTSLYELECTINALYSGIKAHTLINYSINHNGGFTVTFSLLHYQQLISTLSVDGYVFNNAPLLYTITQYLRLFVQSIVNFITNNSYGYKVIYTKTSNSVINKTLEELFKTHNISLNTNTLDKADNANSVHIEPAFCAPNKHLLSCQVYYGEGGTIITQPINSSTAHGSAVSTQISVEQILLNLGVAFLLQNLSSNGRLLGALVKTIFFGTKGIKCTKNLLNSTSINSTVISDDKFLEIVCNYVGNYSNEENTKLMLPKFTNSNYVKLLKNDDSSLPVEYAQNSISKWSFNLRRRSSLPKPIPFIAPSITSCITFLPPDIDNLTFSQYAKNIYGSFGRHYVSFSFTFAFIANPNNANDASVKLQPSIKQINKTIVPFINSAMDELYFSTTGENFNPTILQSLYKLTYYVDFYPVHTSANEIYGSIMTGKIFFNSPIVNTNGICILLDVIVDGLCKVNGTILKVVLI